MSSERAPSASGPRGGVAGLDALAAVVLAAALVRYAGRLWPPAFFDDAFIFLRYADNLLRGCGPTFNCGEPAGFGTTSLLHLWLVTLVRASGLLGAQSLLVAVSAAPGLAALFVMARSCARHAPLPLLGASTLRWSALLVVVIGGTPLFAYHSTTGMDTLTATLANALLVHAALGAAAQPSSATPVRLALLAWLSLLGRLDSGLVAFGLPGLLLLRPAGDAPRRRLLLRFALAALACLALDTAFKVFVFGDPLPLPVYAKHHGALAGYAGAAKWEQAAYLRELAGATLPFSAAWLLWPSLGSGLFLAFALPLAGTFAGLADAVQIMGFHARYYVPLLPVIVVGGALAASRFWAAAGGIEGLRREPRGLVARAGVGLLVVFSLPWLSNGYERIREAAFPNPTPGPAVEPPRAPGPPLPSLGWARSIAAMSRLAVELPAGARLASSEIGLVGASAPQLVVVDVAGLTDRRFAHEGPSAAALLERRPDLVWLPHDDYRPLRAELLGSSDWRAAYLLAPGAFDYGLAVRCDGPHREPILARVDALTRAVYGRALSELLAPGWGPSCRPGPAGASAAVR